MDVSSLVKSLWNKRILVFQLLWIFTFAVSGLSAASGCFAHSSKFFSHLMGLLSLALLGCGIGLSLKALSLDSSRSFASNTARWLSLPFLPCVVGDWRGGIGLTALILPICAYLFAVNNERLHRWIANVEEN